MILKVLSVVLLGIGAFLVYGAKFIATCMDKDKITDAESTKPCGDDNISEDRALSEGGEGSFEEGEKLDEVPNQTVLKVKLAGAAFVVAGVVLALVAFR